MRRFTLFLSALALIGCSSFPNGNVAQFSSQVQTLVKDMPEVTVKTTGNTVFLDGTLTSFETARRLEKIVASLRETAQPGGAQVNSLVKLAPEALGSVAERVEREIGSPEITVRAVHHTLLLEGTADSDFEADRALEITQIHLYDKRASSGVQSVSNASRDLSADKPGTNYVIPSVTIVDMMRVRPPAGAGKLKGKLTSQR